MRMLHIASKFTRNREHLIQIYKTFIRCNLEFSSNVWHSSLTKENRQDLERVQKAALKVILKNDYDNYENALRISGLQSLNERRDVMSLKFAKNCLKNSNFSKLFPKNEVKHEMKKRNTFKYAVRRANTERLKRSSIPYMQRLLNNDNKKRKSTMENLMSEWREPKRFKTQTESYCTSELCQM